MKVELESRLNEISMLLLMAGGSDEVGLDACVDLIKKICDAAKGAEDLARLLEASSAICAKRESLKGQEFADLVERYVSAAQGFLSGSKSAHFPNENGDAPTNDEFGVNFSAEFLPEFIEKHGIALEEFEGKAMDFQFVESGEPEAIAVYDNYVRKYLHNIKGDAGSLGLIGVEKVTHEFEELLLDSPPSKEIDRLLQYKEWLSAYIKALGANKEVPQTSAEFLKDLLAGQSSEVSTTVSTTNLPAEEPATVAPVSVVAAAPKVAEPSPASGKDDDLGSYAVIAENEIFFEFKAEAEDHLSSVEGVLLTANNVFSHEDIDTIFRAVHSLKGASAYFNLVEIKETSHVLENLLDEVRDGKRELDPALVNLVFSYIDLQKTLLRAAQLALTNNVEIRRSQTVVSYLNQLTKYAEGAAVEVAPAPTAVVEAPNEKAMETKAEPKHPTQDTAPTEATPSVVAEAKSEARKAEAPKVTDKMEIRNFVKIDTSRLDLLLDSIGEMVIYSSMLIRSCRDMLGGDENVMKTSHQVEKFSRELQDIGMSMRLDPIKGLFQKMSRLVWDVSKKIGKEINFTMTGEDTELDRTVIEKLADPLMHMVRNAIDHGIEAPEDRIRAGKSRVGTVDLSASHQGGSILITIRDDGRGLDPAKLTAKAIEKGVIPAGTSLSEQEAFRLIFAPGFSTAAAVTDISGRGVGMDVVRNNIEGMRGQIRIESEVGRGSTFSIELPLTLAIIDGIETVVGCERFIIPTLSVLEFMKPSPGMISTTVSKGETFFFRGLYLPLYRLSNLFDLESEVVNPEDGIVVVLESGTEQIALMVDDMIGSCQTVIKSLGKMFDEGRGIAGCAIMPNGSIGLILDVRSLIQLTRSDYRADYVDERAMQYQH